MLAPHTKHVRRAKWLKVIPRSEFDQDLLYPLGAIMTVCRIERNDAEKRIRMMLVGVAPPKPDGAGDDGVELEQTIDIENYAKDEIVKQIAVRFKGHGLA